MNSEGFAFACYQRLMAEKYDWVAVHGWNCPECRDEWAALQIEAMRPEIEVKAEG